ncbi:MAG: hypothetical protein NZ849_07425 [Meiothermus sp.]|uniref:hypothetical protein n=1 Tax=Meiothermus sp. TaxID=1955249 RepID=UPI0025E5DF7D|nr:hypothetical protein [Meiothermus sp.]MCS7058212.1 hypothetical protein [Meiothermus sp.]MCS7194723.1 hypothetical protein [Meiothermus sp.]MCX7739472.1 hypothetical protein [Meiothermus sp.]MDW8091424.1 hypothetical protein [Meiothermus sp.]MDW8481354.1 hypothetical protein [Meiothermus sp.]
MVPGKVAWWGRFLGFVLLLGLAFGLGRWSAPSEGLNPQPFGGQAVRVQFDPQQPLQAAPDARELIPLLPGPGQGPGTGSPQEGQECPLLIYQDGQLYRFELPGQPMPGGPLPGPGMPEGSPELIPLEPQAPQPSPPPRQEPGPNI